MTLKAMLVVIYFGKFKDTNKKNIDNIENVKRSLAISKSLSGFVELLSILHPVVCEVSYGC